MTGLPPPPPPPPQSQLSGTFRGEDSDAPDVLVVVPLQTFYLHSAVLRSVSRRFAAHISRGRQGGGDGGVGGQYRFYYGIDYNGDGEPSLQVTAGPHELGPVPPCRETQEKHRAAFRALFAIFYRRRAALATLDECAAVVALAAGLEALDAVADGVCARVLEWPGLGDRIREAPAGYLQLAYRVRCARVFREAFVHVVGAGGGGGWCSEAAAAAAPECVVALVRAEGARVRGLVVQAVKRLLCVGAAVAGGGGGEGRVAAAVVRERVAACVWVHRGEGREGALFRMLGAGFDVSAGDVAGYSGSADVGGVVESAAEIVREVREIARGLVGCNLRLAGHGEEIPYLTCAELADEEMPWALSSCSLLPAEHPDTREALCLRPGL